LIYDRTPESDIPGPPPFPIIGRWYNMLQFGRDAVGYCGRLFDRYGKVAMLVKGAKSNLYSPLDQCPGTVLAYGPEATRAASTQHEIYFKYPLSGPHYRLKDRSVRTAPLKHFAVGLFGVNLEEHRQHRRLVMPAFQSKRISSYRDTMVDITESCLNDWRIGEQRNILHELRLLTMRIATQTLFGEDIGEHSRRIGPLLQKAVNALAHPLTQLFPYDLAGLPFHRFFTLSAEIDVEMRRIIEHKRKAGHNGNDMLSSLLQARDAESGLALSEDELIGHTNVFFVAGHETTANALTWTLFLLSQHPNIAADLVDELHSVLHGTAPSVEQLEELPLLDQVIKESLRLFTPAPFNGRVISQPTEFCGYELPAGMEVFVSIYHTHRMPEVYPEPARFHPRRWESMEPSIFEYNPFSAGPRLCIGWQFALQEMKVVLAMLMQRIRLRCVPKLVINRTGAIVLTPEGGLPMIIHAQDRLFQHGVGGVRGNVRDMVELPP
jgi:cytochrome P450